MNKKSVLVLLLGLLWLGGGKAEEKQEKIDPPDWYKAGVVAALQDKNSDISYYDFSVLKTSPEELISYLSAEQKKLVIYNTAKHLADADSNIREKAIKTLGELQAKSEIPKIIESLKDNSPDVRKAAIEELGNLYAKSAIPKIVELLKDNSPDVRKAAIEELGNLYAKSAIPKIVELLKDNSPDVRKTAINSLQLFQATEAIPNIVESLKDNDEYVRFAAVTMLNQLQAKEEAIPKLVEFLKNNDSYVRYAAINALGNLQATEVAPNITESLIDNDGMVRYAAINALVRLQGKEAIPNIIKFLKDDDSSVRKVAIAALGELQAKEAIPNIIKFLKDDDSSVRKVAIAALGELQAKEAIPELVELLADKDRNVRSAVIKALGQLQAKEAIPKIVESLKDYDSSVRYDAITALEQLQAKEAIPEIISFLKDNIEEQSETAIEVLAKLQAKEAIPNIIECLKKDNPVLVRKAAIEALGELQAKEALSKIVDSLKDDEDLIRTAAVAALGKLQAKEMITNIIEFLKIDDSGTRKAAIESLVQLQAKNAIPNITESLKDNNNGVRKASIVALKYLQAKEAIPNIIESLKDNESEVRDAAIETLGRLQVEEKNLMPETLFIAIHHYLALLYNNTDSTREKRFITHLLAGSRFQTLVWCLGNNDPQDCNKQTFQNDHEKTVKALTLFKDFYKAIPKDKFSPKLRDDLVVKINMVAEALVEQQTELTFEKLWQELTQGHDFANKFQIIADIFAVKEDVTLLDDLSKLIEKDGYDTTDLKRKRDAILETQEWLQQVIEYGGIICLHLGFWMMLIFLYPRSRMIQAIFFWNPWVQGIVGLGYVTFCLTWIPFLRRRLLSPFQDSLLADANLATFQPHLYFANMSITLKGLNQPQPLLETLAKSRGQIILEGESGLGKTMYLRHLAQHSTRAFAFLHATRCTAGVIPALKEKLHGFAQNETFLTSIIYAGGVDLCIDGLNEVSPDTRAKITQFVEQHFKGTILLSTQPLEWQPPQTAKTYRLLPLNRLQIEAFLLSRPEQPDNYQQTCTEYLNSALSPQLDLALQELHFKILSNPMDLTVVAHLLAQGIQPNLDNLIQQQYQTMNEDYQSKSFNQNFPLNKFAQHVFEIRLQDKRVLNHADFGKELDCLEEYKLVIKRMEKEGEINQENYYFRHDKIWDFFNAHVFKQHDNEWRKSYFADERFRGAFLALAWSLPLNEAQSLLDKLQHYIVESNDNILHHQYYQLLDLRNRLPH